MEKFNFNSAANHTVSLGVIVAALVAWLQSGTYTLVTFAPILGLGILYGASVLAHRAQSTRLMTPAQAATIGEMAAERGLTAAAVCAKRYGETRDINTLVVSEGSALIEHLKTVPKLKGTEQQ